MASIRLVQGTHLWCISLIAVDSATLRQIVLGGRRKQVEQEQRTQTSEPQAKQHPSLVSALVPTSMFLPQLPWMRDCNLQAR